MVDGTRDWESSPDGADSRAFKGEEKDLLDRTACTVGQSFPVRRLRATDG
jgi:hypothetical protein